MEIKQHIVTLTENEALTLASALELYLVKSMTDYKVKDFSVFESLHEEELDLLHDFRATGNYPMEQLGKGFEYKSYTDVREWAEDKFNEI